MGVVDQSRCRMRIFIGGVGCVGKTATGARLADLLTLRFFDLDTETERFFATSIERLQNSHLTPHGFRQDIAKALEYVLSLDESRNCVIALPPRGLMGPCWSVVKKVSDAVIAVLDDRPENILDRVMFYDIDSRPIDKALTEDERVHYLREIKGDIRYFRRSRRNANLIVDIAGCDADGAARRVLDALPHMATGEATD